MIHLYFFVIMKNIFVFHLIITEIERIRSNVRHGPQVKYFLNLSIFMHMGNGHPTSLVPLSG